MLKYIIEYYIEILAIILKYITGKYIILGILIDDIKLRCF